jgi:tRNA-Thr(GGU) m(6)t(6)A37 methyltransferase TsaA
VLVLTWLDRADRATLEVHPRDDTTAPLRGVFSTRSPDRPNPIGIHRVTILEVASPIRFKVDALEAIDGTPIVDVKPVLDRRSER